MPKPFIDESYNGIKTAMDADEVANTVDTCAGSRLAVIMYEADMISGEEFLKVIRPRSFNGEIRVRGGHDYGV